MQPAVTSGVAPGWGLSDDQSTDRTAGFSVPHTGPGPRRLPESHPGNAQCGKWWNSLDRTLIMFLTLLFSSKWSLYFHFIFLLPVLIKRHRELLVETEHSFRLQVKLEPENIVDAKDDISRYIYGYKDGRKLLEWDDKREIKNIFLNNDKEIWWCWWWWSYEEEEEQHHNK